MTRLIDFKTTKVSACVCKDPDGDLIFLNARCSSEKNRRSYDHEIEHLRCDDLYGEEDAALIEARAHER